MGNLKKFYFTFGLGSPLKKRYQVIYAEDYDTARKLMVETYGDKWSWQYSEKAWAVVLRNNPKMREYTALENVIYQE